MESPYDFAELLRVELFSVEQPENILVFVLRCSTTMFNGIPDAYQVCEYLLNSNDYDPKFPLWGEPSQFKGYPTGRSPWQSKRCFVDAVTYLDSRLVIQCNTGFTPQKGSPGKVITRPVPELLRESMAAKKFLVTSEATTNGLEKFYEFVLPFIKLEVIRTNSARVKWKQDQNSVRPTDVFGDPHPDSCRCSECKVFLAAQRVPTAGKALQVVANGLVNRFTKATKDTANEVSRLDVQYAVTKAIEAAKKRHGEENVLPERQRSQLLLQVGAITSNKEHNYAIATLSFLEKCSLTNAVRLLRQYETWVNEYLRNLPEDCAIPEELQKEQVSEILKQNENPAVRERKRLITL